MSRSALPLLLCLAVALQGCTAGIAMSRVASASRAVRDIEERGAEQLAPYEYRLAREHLAKALEETGNGEHKTGVEMAKAASAWSERALARIDRGGRNLDELPAADESLSEDLLEGDDVFQETVKTAPEAPPAPPPPEEPEKKDDFGDFLEEPEPDEGTWEGSPK